MNCEHVKPGDRVTIEVRDGGCKPRVYTATVHRVTYATFRALGYSFHRGDGLSCERVPLARVVGVEEPKPEEANRG